MRFMNEIDKAAEMRGWAMAKQTPLPTGFTGGHGYPDPEMFAWCDRLNALSRLCTLQSCAGHRCTPASSCNHCAQSWRCATCGSNATDCFYRQHASYTKADRTERHEFAPTADEHVWNAQLWLWPDEKLARWCYDHLPSLALLKPRIDKVGLLWHVECREIVDIQFQGAGHGQLENSMSNIVAFFEQGNRECNLG